MVHLLLTPGAPFFALSLAGALLGTIGLLRMERARELAVGVRLIPKGASLARRVALGQAAAIPLAGSLLLAGVAGGVSGMSQALIVALALAAYLSVGVVAPRRPIARAARERAALRRLTPGFVSYVRVAMAGYESPGALLERYVARPRPPVQPMQALVSEAIELARERRLRPFEGLCVVARARGCVELTDVAEALAHAEAEGSDPQPSLAAHAATLEAILRDEFTRTLRRRTLWLLCVVAVSLVVGVLGNLLFVMTAGGSVLRGGL